MSNAAVVLQLGTSRVGLDTYNNRIFAGRDPAASQLAFLDEKLSRRHAEIWLAQNTLWIRALGSANGTWVNGQAVGGSPVALAPDMQVYLGPVPLAVSWTGGGAIAAVAPAPAFQQQVAQHQALNVQQANAKT